MTAATEKPAALSDVLQHGFLDKPLEDWHQNSSAIFAELIQDVIYDIRKGPVTEQSDILMTMFDHGLKTAPPAVREALQRDDGDPVIRATYMLGCLAMAQQLLATVASRRPDDAFYEVFKDPQAQKVLNCLLLSETLKRDIPAKAGLAQTTVDVLLKDMLRLGIADYRLICSDAGATQSFAQYFLTPAAKQMLESSASQKTAA